MDAIKINNLPHETVSTASRAETDVITIEDAGCDHYDAVVVGSGPIGLLTALTINSGSVLMLEKRDEYTRGHTVKIEKSSLKEILKNCTDQDLSSLLREIIGHTPINKIEKKLAELAGNRGIEILRGKNLEIGKEGCPTLREIVQKFTPKVVIASDGKKSACMREVDRNNNENRVVHDNFQTLLKVDFVVSNRWKEAFDANKQGLISSANTKGLEYRIQKKIWGPSFSKQDEETGEYKVSAFFQLKRKENDYLTSLAYKQGFVKKKEDSEDLIPFASFKNPITLEKCRQWSDNPDNPLYRLTKESLPIFEAIDEKDLHSFTAVALPITAYMNKDFYAVVDNVPVLYAGDSAGGVPYQRSINGAFRTVWKTSLAARSLIQSEESVEQNKELKKFVKYSKSVWKEEIFVAMVKKIGLIFLDAIKTIIGAIAKVFGLLPPLEKNALDVDPINGARSFFSKVYSPESKEAVEELESKEAVAELESKEAV